MELVLQCKLELAAFPRFTGCFYPLQMEPLKYRIHDIGFRIFNMEPKPFQMQENPFQGRGNRGNNTEIMWKVPFPLK